MADPLSIAVLGGVALTEGIKFLYGQVGELLRRRRESRAAAAADQSAPAQAARVDIPSTDGGEHVLSGRLTPGPVDAEALDSNAEQLASLRGLLMPYAEGDRSVDAANRQVLEQIDATRRLLEVVYGQHITFQGEQRPASGAPVHADTQAEEMGQYAARVIAEGERSIAVGHDVSNSVLMTGDVRDPEDIGRLQHP